MTEAERKRLIKQRQEDSQVWQVIHWLGSLKLAVGLLITIALACAIATFTESKFTTKIAQHYIYRAPWFNGWLIVLCLNLLAAALTRWPWQKKHLGFVITHAGIITLLIGAMIGRMTGFEASVTLQKDQPATSRLVINETTLLVQSPKDGEVYTLPLPVEVRPPSETRPRLLEVPDSPLKLKIDRYAESLHSEPVLVTSTDAGASPGVLLKFSSQSLGQSMDIPLLAASDAERKRDFFGLAHIEWLDQLPAVPIAAKPVLFRETHVVLAAQPDQPIVQNSTGKLSGYHVVLVPHEKSSSELEVVVTDPKGDSQKWPVPSLAGKTVSSPTDAVQVKLTRFWPDFTMENGKPSSRSKELRNPALMVDITGPVTVPAGDAKPVFQLAPVANGKIAYQLKRSGSVYATGNAGPGESVVLGWNDWKATVVTVEPRAALRTELHEHDTGDDQSRPGIRIALQTPEGITGEPTWVASGTSQNLKADKHVILVGFGLKTHMVPFTIRLEDFQVPRDQGTDTPSDFISTVLFENPDTGETVMAKAHMNHPANFPGEFWRSVLGRNYKFSQASWNPENLNETTLQVLFDPGWPAKWVGSLLICLGIIIMFYFKPAPASRTPAATSPIQLP